MSVFAFIELKLNRTTQILIGHIAQNIFRLNNSPKIGKRLRKTIRWKTVGEPLYDDMGRCCTFMVRKLNRPLLGFLTMNRVKEEPHMVRPFAE